VPKSRAISGTPLAGRARRLPGQIPSRRLRCGGNISLQIFTIAIFQSFFVKTRVLYGTFGKG